MKSNRHIRDDSYLRERFTQAVIDSGLTHTEIAKRANLSRTTVSYAVNGTHRASITTWDRILRACEVEIGYRFT